MDQLDDTTDLAELLGLVATGDEVALARLWHAVAPILLGLCLKLLRRRHAAEDALQESFVRIWHKAGQYDPALGRPLSWMATVARNVALDQLRRERHRGETDLEEAEVLPAPTEASLGLDLTRTDLAHCLDQLPATQRLAILLAYYRGMTHQELAQALGAPLGTVKSWVRRGLSNLKDCLG